LVTVCGSSESVVKGSTLLNLT